MAYKLIPLSHEDYLFTTQIFKDIASCGTNLAIYESDKLSLHWSGQSRTDGWLQL